MEMVKNENKFFFSCKFWNSFKDFLVFLEVTLTHLNSEFFEHCYLPETTIFGKYQLFPVRKTDKNFSVHK